MTITNDNKFKNFQENLEICCHHKFTNSVGNLENAAAWWEKLQCSELQTQLFWASAIYSTLLLYLQHCCYIFNTPIYIQHCCCYIFNFNFNCFCCNLFVKQIQAGMRVIWELFQSFVIFFQKKGPRDQIPNLANFDIFPGVFLEAGFKIQNFAPFPWVFREAGEDQYSESPQSVCLHVCRSN